MTKYKLEYIWLDGYTPAPNLRGKTQIKEFDSFPTLEQLPLWGFDGSSTMQAEGHSSDCVLKPVAVYPDGARTNGALVMCEVMMPDGKTPHATNKRATILDDPGAWFGFEQEYFEKLMDAFKANRADHIAVYGPDNHMRLTGKHETAAIGDFTYGIADRGASIRVPHSFANNGYKGYLEDRRPNSQGDPYQIASQILKTIALVPTVAKSAAA